MLIRSSTIILVLFSLFSIILAKTGPAHDKVVVCYISTWAVYRPGKGSYSLDKFDASLCTHAVYAFAGLDNENDAIKSTDPWQDLKDDFGKGGYEKLNALKDTYPHLKVSLAIGGWNEGSKNYSQLVASPVRRQRFIKQTTQFIKKFKFDGLDLDWEYPALRGGAPEDKQNFVLLVKEFREEFNKHNLLLTSAFGASKKTIDLAYDVRALSYLLDFMHIMCYDYGGSWDKKIAPNAPLTNDGDLNIEFSIEYLISQGASPSKIVLGIPFYGRTFITSLPGNYDDPSDDVGFQGPYTRENGFMGYNEICEVLTNKSSGWTRDWDSRTAQGIARHRDASGKTKVVTFDTTRSVANKMRYAIRQDLAGVMVWSVDTDDFLGDCTAEQDTFADFGDSAGIRLSIPKREYNNYPLLRTMNTALIVAEDELRQENEIRRQEIENEIIHGESGSANVISLKSYLIGFVVCVFIFKL